MRREELADLNAFVAVAEERSFTRAAAKLGTSQSALSFTIRRLEERLGVRLLTPNDAERRRPPRPASGCSRTLGPALDKIGAELAALSELREKPAGTIRITAGEHAAEAVLWPALATLLPHYPDIKVELIVDYGLTDIVAERYDAGVRLGEQVAQGHDRRAHRPGLPHGRCRRAVVLRRTTAAEDSRRTLRPTTASISACRPTAGSSPGNSRSAGAS